MVEVMLDSGSSVSLIRQKVLNKMQGITKIQAEVTSLRLVTASENQLPMLDHIRVPVILGELKLMHDFVVVESLVSPVILGIDFLQSNALVLDFGKTPVQVSLSKQHTNELQSNATPPVALEMYETHRRTRAKVCTVKEIERPGDDVVEECAIPMFIEPSSIELPQCQHPDFLRIIREYSNLFRTKPGITKVSQHIPTEGNPVKVPPWHIPVHYRERIQKQIEAMLDQGIIEPSTWMALAVFVPKKSGEIRLCVDYQELNKKTVKDAYPLPLPDEVQDCLAGSTLFSTLDLQSGYWQLPINPGDREKTAFCPGPGMGLYQFCRMPFGLTGAPSSYQRLMDTILKGLSFITIYLDDIQVHSKTKELHEYHHCCAKAGLSLKGKKCHIGMSSVSYCILGIENVPCTGTYSSLPKVNTRSK